MNMQTVEIKAFVPARDFELSKRFYRDLGFEIPWSDDALAYLHAGDASFLLQNFYLPEHAGNFVMHLLVADVEAWWRHVESQRLAERYGVRASPPEDRPWAIRDFVLADPSGVLWRIGQNIGGPRAAHGESAARTSGKSTTGDSAVHQDPTRFEGTSLADAYFQDVNLDSAHFIDVNLANASFSDVSLVGARLHDVDLGNVAITHANLEGMTIDGIAVTELLRAYKGWPMDYAPFIRKLRLPDGFTPPTRLTYDDIVATALTRDDLHEDVLGINASLDLINATRGGGWPTEAVTEAYNHVDLVWHELEFREAASFAYVVRDTAGTYLGCCYLYPMGRRTELSEPLLGYDVDASWWVTTAAYERGYYAKLHQALGHWLATSFPFWRPYYSNIEIPGA